MADAEVVVSEGHAYQELIFRHSKDPVGLGALPAGGLSATAVNSLCGDEVTIGLAWVAGGAQLGFVSSGCSLCRASASIMIAAASAKTAVELGPMIADFRKKFSSLEPIAVDPDPTDLGALYDLRRYPSRQRCVLLAWDAIAKLLYT